MGGRWGGWVAGWVDGWASIMIISLVLVLRVGDTTSIHTAIRYSEA